MVEFKYFYSNSIFKLVLIVLLIKDAHQHEKKLNEEIFLPFGPLSGDLLVPVVDDGFVGPISISTTFPFYQKSFTDLFVNTNGLVSFNRSITSFVPQPFPLDNVITVAPFWADVDTRNGGNIYYREIIDQRILNLISQDIQRAFSTFYNFRVAWAFVTTWDEVAAYRGSSRNNNTFQVVLATNGRYSFTIFNYGRLMWSLGTASSGTHAQAGFNAGDGKTYYVLPGSFTSNVINLSELTNVDVRGKWIFRIDSQNVTEGGCNTAGFLTIYPNIVRFVGGGEHIFVYGPCFEFNNTYTMVFDNDTETTCTVVDSTYSVCEVPLLQRIGKITLKMSINGNFSFEGFIISKGMSLKPEIQGLEYLYRPNELGNVTISWNYGKNNILRDDYSDDCAVVYIYVDELTNKSERIFLNESTSCTGSSEIDLSVLLQQKKFDISKIKQEFIGVLRKIKSTVISTLANAGSYIVMSTVFIFTSDNADKQCKDWHSTQPDPTPTLNGLPPCWREVPLDRNGNFPLAFGDFTQDPSCNPNNPKLCDLFHNGAKGCYRSISAFNGAGQQCCYSAQNRILVGPPGGGTLDAGHPDNPLLHFWRDVKTYFICCKYSNNCDLYYEKRPSDDGSRWTPVIPGGGSGKKKKKLFNFKIF